MYELIQFSNSVPNDIIFHRISQTINKKVIEKFNITYAS